MILFAITGYTSSFTGPKQGWGLFVRVPMGLNLMVIVETHGSKTVAQETLSTKIMAIKNEIESPMSHHNG